MAAAVYHGRGDIRVEERPVPEVRPGELLVRVATAGVCGTDSGEWDHGPVQHPVHARHPASGHLGPVIPGHEFSGTVEAVGPGVDADWLGREVASCGAVACGTCPPCARGESNRCTTYVGVGLHRDGALAGYVLTPPESCVPLDGFGISLDEAALCQPMAIAVHCASRAGDIEGQTVVVLGVGGGLPGDHRRLRRLGEAQPGEGQAEGTEPVEQVLRVERDAELVADQAALHGLGRLGVLTLTGLEGDQAVGEGEPDRGVALGDQGDPAHRLDERLGLHHRMGEQRLREQGSDLGVVAVDQ